MVHRLQAELPLWPFSAGRVGGWRAAKSDAKQTPLVLTAEKSLPVIDAYPLMSIAVDLNITQLVDGRKGVHAMLPKAILEMSACGLFRRLLVHTFRTTS